MYNGSSFHKLSYGKVTLAYTWFNLNLMLTRIVCLWLIKHVFLHLLYLLKKKNTFKNQNGVTVVQASKMELGNHCECGFRNILYCWELEFSELYQTQGHHYLFSKQCLLGASSCNFMVSSCNYAIILTLNNLCLISTLTSCQAQL